MIGRRLMVLMAVLLGLTALATSLAPRPQPTRRGAATATPAPTVTPTPTVRSRPARVVARTLEADAKQPVRVHARVGDTVQLVITGDVLDSVEVEGFDEIEQIDPDSPALIELLADGKPASHAIRLIDSGREIGQLKID
jgi:hypothetical protein